MKMKDRPQDIQDAYKKAVKDAVKRGLDFFIQNNPNAYPYQVAYEEHHLTYMESWSQEISESASNEEARQWYGIK